MRAGLKPYFLSKWICPTHGHFTARTEKAVDPLNPIHCPDCKSFFVAQTPGMTSQTIPHISKPRIPEKADKTRTFSDKAPVHKRGKSWS